MHAAADEQRRPAFVATTGGHLVELDLLAAVLEPDRHRDGLWITHRTPQSESMLRGRRVLYVDHVGARDVGTVLWRIPGILAALRRHRVDTAYSTGAALALSSLPLARLVGARAQYIESLTRPRAPSLTGRVLERVPWVDLHTQYPHNASGRWRHQHSALDAVTVVPAGPAREPARIFVTLGTSRPWQFRRLVDRVLAIAPPGSEIVWQTGATEVGDLPIAARARMSDDEFREHIGQADVVVAHAGLGTFLRCLEAGKVPVVVPRSVTHGEHVDDHQQQFAAVADRRGLAVVRQVDQLTAADLAAATALRASLAHPRPPAGPTRHRTDAPPDGRATGRTRRADGAPDGPRHRRAAPEGPA